jgi:hypothetical protein
VGVHFPSGGGITQISYDRCNRGLNGAPLKCYWTSGSFGVGGTHTYPLYDRVISATKNGQVWSFMYTWNIGGYYAQYVATGPTGTKSLFFYSGSGGSWPMWLQMPDARYVFSGGPDSRVVSKTYSANGIAETYSYDARGNVTQVTYTPATGSSLPAETVVANYETNCSNPKTCNKPNFIIDRANKRTDYTYDPVHGQVTREAGPAVNGIRPVHRYYYTQRFAWYRDPSGAFVRDPDGVWLLTSAKMCRTSETVGDACAASNDEDVVTYDYGPDAGPNNLWLRGKSTTAGGITLRICYGYDRYGNQISETTANAGLASCN